MLAHSGMQAEVCASALALFLTGLRQSGLSAHVRRLVFSPCAWDWYDGRVDVQPTCCLKLAQGGNPARVNTPSRWSCASYVDR
eukprot:64969-Alexandrium_andersonii.AAC.1